MWSRGGSGDFADQLAVRRGNVYFPSEDFFQRDDRSSGYSLKATESFSFGEPTDIAFTAQRETPYEAFGEPEVLYGDGIALRRNG